MSQPFRSRIRAALRRFVAWLDRYGETSYDHQSFFAGPARAAAKALYYRSPTAGTLAVAPMILCEAFIPSARRLFWRPQRFPIADAHYAMGFAYLRACSASRRTTACRAFPEGAGGDALPGLSAPRLGLPVRLGDEWRHHQAPDSAHHNGAVCIRARSGKSTSYDKDEQWRRSCGRSLMHALLDYHDLESSPAASCAYTPRANDPGGTINASAYRAALLTAAAAEFSGDRIRRDGFERNLNFVLDSQNADGSWHYSVDGQRDFVDHFHTCFVLKALAKIEALTGDPRCTAAIGRGIDYYVRHLFDEERLPRPFARAPRLTVYRSRALRLRRVRKSRHHFSGAGSRSWMRSASAVLQDTLGPLAEAGRIFPVARASPRLG